MPFIHKAFIQSCPPIFIYTIRDSVSFLTLSKLIRQSAQGTHNGIHIPWWIRMTKTHTFQIFQEVCAFREIIIRTAKVITKGYDNNASPTAQTSKATDLLGNGIIFKSKRLFLSVLMRFSSKLSDMLRISLLRIIPLFRVPCLCARFHCVVFGNIR